MSTEIETLVYDRKARDEFFANYSKLQMVQGFRLPASRHGPRSKQEAADGTCQHARLNKVYVSPAYEGSAASASEPFFVAGTNRKTTKFHRQPMPFAWTSAVLVLLPSPAQSGGGCGNQTSEK